MMQQRTALVVEDDLSTAELVSEVLCRAGFAVTRVGDGAEAVRVVEISEPDVIALDVCLPGMDGIEVCRRIREFSDCYIVMLTGRAEEIDVIVGLEVGADDVVAEPFSPRELTARVAALLRRPRSRSGDIRDQSAAGGTPIDGGAGLRVDCRARTVTINGEVVELTRTEFDMLAYLAVHAGSVVPREELVRQVWGTPFTGEGHMVDVHLANVRRKMRQHSTISWIRTVRGVGFRFDAA